MSVFISNGLEKKNASASVEEKVKIFHYEAIRGPTCTTSIKYSKSTLVKLVASSSPL